MTTIRLYLITNNVQVKDKDTHPGLIPAFEAMKVFVPLTVHHRVPGYTIQQFNNSTLERGANCPSQGDLVYISSDLECDCVPLASLSRAGLKKI